MDQKKDIGHLRKSYDKYSLGDELISANPHQLFVEWFDDAKDHPAIEEANAMSIVTIGVDQFPKARVVLLKAYSEEGFIFYTNYNSDKGKSILSHPKVGLSFFWPQLERQVIIRGIAEKVDPSVSDAYFYSRPLGSQLGAIASAQSSIVASSEVLEQELALLNKKHKDTPPKRPDHWGGFLVRPITIEFWQGRPNRMHDRIEFTQLPSKKWEGKRLSP